MKLSAEQILDNLFSEQPLSNELMPHQIIDIYYNLYLDNYGNNNALNGKIFENLLLYVLKDAGISPIYFQAKMAFVPNVDFDILLYNPQTPVVISAKTSLRERWKQADIEAFVLKNVHRKAICYVLTLSEREVLSRRNIDTNYLGIDSFVIANKPEFDDWLANLKQIPFEQAGSINIVETNNRFHI